MRARLRKAMTRAAVVAVAVGLGAAGFAASGFAMDKIRAGTPEGRAFMFAVLDVGNQAGIFKKHDVEVEKINFQGGAKLQQGLASNSIDVSVASTGDILFVAKGLPARAIAQFAGPPVDLALIVRADGSITDPKQLKGRKIAVTSVGSLTHFLAGKLAEMNGWGADGVERVAVGGMSSEIAALTTKKVDAAVGPTEVGLHLEQEGRGKILVDYGKVLPDWVTHYMYANTTAMKERPDAIRKFLAGWYDTIAYMRANKDETVKIISAVTGVPPALTARAYDVEMPAMNESGQIDKQALEVLKKTFIPAKMQGKIANAQLIDESFLK